ncbi:MAG: HAD hydrolase family protein [Bacteroidales bacterium]|jgi:3-deoxy-D-manno-octulosonate 8-phosphate phosphatase (KDO 8-P phosphatase)|nr:HAD hydrolase family protein [Bacteroidales bacterium]MDI9576291.1 HAD hydrolase family protein [Bacteroidota bacterium]MDD2593177.1 HAD hydrolase family protein [Bacteroidales bacterium]MDD3756302.1 HAD hydrolase family protein [Bacteroidales bacterium]MDY0401580.1 HAD hydrolase family protein [Bacteroidales bacterium]
MKNYKEKLKNITTIILDYDGVLTDGKVYIVENGREIRAGNVKDSYILQLLIKKGFNVIMISGSNADSIRWRCKSLNIENIHLGIVNKLTEYELIKKKFNINDYEILFIGDDIPDYELMINAGVSVCPADAAQEIKEVADYISRYEGGKGCVREIGEQILKAQNKWMDKECLEW